jgi:hypothetical protein
MTGAKPEGDKTAIRSKSCTHLKMESHFERTCRKTDDGAFASTTFGKLGTHKGTTIFPVASIGCKSKCMQIQVQGLLRGSLDE